MRTGFRHGSGVGRLAEEDRGDCSGSLRSHAVRSPVLRAADRGGRAGENRYGADETVRAGAGARASLVRGEGRVRPEDEEARSAPELRGRRGVRVRWLR